MAYDESAIRCAGGEARIEQALLNNERLPLKTHDEETLKLVYGLEHYIVKYYAHPKTPDLAVKINQKVAGLIRLFEAHPDYIIYSYILSNKEVIHSFLSQADLNRMYHNGVAKLTVNWEETYNKLMKNEPVTEQERNNLFSYFTMMINFKKDQNKNQKYVNSKIEEYVHKMLQENTIPSNDNERLFLFNYCSKFVFAQEGFPEQRRNIRVVDLKTPRGFLGGYQLESLIALNDHPCQDPKFFHTLDQMVQCAMHETTHAIQEIQAKKEPNSVHGMEMAIQKAFGQRDYKTGENYLFNEIEENAQLRGYWYARILYTMAKNETVSKKLFEEQQEYHMGRRFQYEYVTVDKGNGQKEIMSKEKYNVTNIRNVVKSNPGLLTQYPVLTHLFDANGNPKTIEEMLEEKFISHDIDSMYEDFILYDLQHQGLDSVDLSKKNSEDKKRILSTLINLLRKEKDYILSILKEPQYREQNAAKTASLYGYHLKKLIIISTFVEKELTWMRKYEKGHNGCYDLFSSYSSTIRALMNALNKAYSDNTITNLKNVTDASATNLTSFDQNIMNEYMNYLVGCFSMEERIKPVNYNGVEYGSLEEFIRTYIRKHMDREHYMYDENGQYLRRNDNTVYDAYSLIRDVSRMTFQYPGNTGMKM